MEILVICGAGASSTFVAQRLSRAAVGADVDLTASAGTVAAPGGAATSPTLVLVGAHIAEDLTQLQERFAPAPVLVLPTDTATDRDGTRTLAFVLAALRPSSPQKGTP